MAHLLSAYAEGVSIFAAVRPEDAEQPVTLPPAAGWNGQPQPNVVVVPFELLDAAQVTGAILETRPDQIVHLAARSSGADADRDAVTAVNVEGTRNVLDAAALLPTFPRALVVSTGYVYGDTQLDRPAREEDPIGPLWRYGPYTDSKIEMESVARNYRAFAITARPFSHTGPGQPPHFALPGFARQLARMERSLEPPVLRVGNLAARRDILDVRDVVRAYDFLLTAGNPGETYNVATGAPVAIRDAVDRLRALCRVPTEVEIDPARLRPADIACSTGDAFRLRETTDWMPRITLESTLRDTLDYWRSQTE